MNVGKVIAELIEKSDYTVADVCRMSGVGKSTIRNMKLGVRKGDLGVIEKIAKVIEVDVSLIFLLSIDPDEDVSEYNKEKFNKLFPNFKENVLQLC